MNTMIELHDSKITDIICVCGNASVHFKYAYLHKSSGRPGIDAGTGWSQGLVITLEKADIFGLQPEFPCDIDDGHLAIGDIRHINIIPFQSKIIGKLELFLSFDDKCYVSIIGSSMAIELTGDPEYIEDFL